MARPIKKGIDYFSFDVDFFEDEKIEPISGEFGNKGEIIIIRLLCAVYRNGYFTMWNEQTKMTLANRCKVSSELVEQVINRLVKWGFIEKTLFDSAKVITSRGIQKRFREATRKRKYNYCALDYWLLDEQKEVISTHNPTQQVLFPPITKQRKVKESKLNTSPLREEMQEEKDFLDSITPPDDGINRNWEHLKRNLREYAFEEKDAKQIIAVSNYGAIGHVVWALLAEIRNSNGRIKQPARFILVKLGL